MIKRRVIVEVTTLIVGTWFDWRWRALLVLVVFVLLHYVVVDWFVVVVVDYPWLTVKRWLVERYWRIGPVVAGVDGDDLTVTKFVGWAVVDPGRVMGPGIDGDGIVVDWCCWLTLLTVLWWLLGIVDQCVERWCCCYWREFEVVVGVVDGTFVITIWLTLCWADRAKKLLKRREEIVIVNCWIVVMRWCCWRCWAFVDDGSDVEQRWRAIIDENIVWHWWWLPLLFVLIALTMIIGRWWRHCDGDVDEPRHCCLAVTLLKIIDPVLLVVQLAKLIVGIVVEGDDVGDATVVVLLMTGVVGWPVRPVIVVRLTVGGEGDGDEERYNGDERQANCYCWFGVEQLLVAVRDWYCWLLTIDGGICCWFDIEHWHWRKERWYCCLFGVVIYCWRWYWRLTFIDDDDVIVDGDLTRNAIWPIVGIVLVVNYMVIVVSEKFVDPLMIVVLLR